ncbi:MAG: hypothetical protein IIB58_02390 [Planctomycetes bacterium]|nr:hypothetical protein [Planctomycetota bacterium]
MRDTNKRVRVTSALCLLFGFSAPALAGDLPCPGNLDGDAFVGPFDLALLLGSWGLCADPCKPGDPENTCAADFNGDCVVGAFDLASLLGAWGPCPGPPVNDICEGAIEIFEGDTEFDTTGATTDPIPAPGCQFLDDLPRTDVWFDYTATCDGLLMVCTCDQAFWDTTLVLYEGCECPITSDRQVACNDDGICVFDLSSRMVTLASAGTCYKIRLGGFGDSHEGPGTLTVTCLEGQDSNCCLGNPEPGCDDPACEAFICSLDPFCCDSQGGSWDQPCVQQALFWCDVCAGGC